MSNEPNSPLPPRHEWKFTPGRLVATTGALEALGRLSANPLSLLGRHLRGDWGSVDHEDWRANEAALQMGARLLSAYPVGPEVVVWVITEADRSTTTFLLPEEY